ncbi:MAG TPA: class I SAM-dependent methyltransferase [Eudoraea sp.]|nr:class I SAM-dependent methyltransferase [Eudoraea sp.]
MHFLSEALENYISSHTEDEPELLRELTRETHLKVVQPRMITGHFQGRLLSILSKIIRPRFVLEIGTYTGYSALCLAEGLPGDGVLHTIDINEELGSMQRKYFNKSGMGHKIMQHCGDALKIIPQFNHRFDLVFIDAEKTDYPHYFEAVLEKTRVGGVILTDNVLWSGKVIEPLKQNDKATQILIEFNKMLKEDQRVESVLLPVRDGLTISLVK